MVRFNKRVIRNHVINYYCDIFSDYDQDTGALVLESVIPCFLVFVLDNTFLTIMPSMEKIKESVFNMDPSNALEPDCYAGNFSLKNWFSFKIFYGFSFFRDKYLYKLKTMWVPLSCRLCI